jgi:chromosome segregation ATPase
MMSMQAASNRDASETSGWQQQCSSLEEERNRYAAKSEESAAAMQRLAESHEKLQAKVLKLASERDHLRLQVQELQVRLSTSHRQLYRDCTPWRHHLAASTIDGMQESMHDDDAGKRKKRATEQVPLCWLS